MVCMAKGIASGMPLGICMTRAEIMDWVPGSHASTFGGNPVSIAAALATMDMLEREAMANAARVGEFMLERLRGWKQTHPLVGDVRGRGLMIGIELVKDKATREPAAALRNRVETLAFERGLMILGCGETSLRLCPPLIVSEHEATVALDILEEALTQVEKEHEHAVRSRLRRPDRSSAQRNASQELRSRSGKSRRGHPDFVLASISLASPVSHELQSASAQLPSSRRGACSRSPRCDARPARDSAPSPAWPGAAPRPRRPSDARARRGLRFGWRCGRWLPWR